jgi:hypothetical protein
MFENIKIEYWIDDFWYYLFILAYAAPKEVIHDKYYRPRLRLIRKMIQHTPNKKFTEELLKCIYKHDLKIFKCYEIRCDIIKELIILYNCIHGKAKSVTREDMDSIFEKHRILGTSNLHQKFWGKYAWKMLHVYSYAIPVLPSNEKQKKLCEFFDLFLSTLPCEKCRKNVIVKRKNLHDLKVALLTRRSTIEFFYTLHNYANLMLGKKIRSMKHLDKKYKYLDN